MSGIPFEAANPWRKRFTSSTTFAAKTDDVSSRSTRSSIFRFEYWFFKGNWWINIPRHRSSLNFLKILKKKFWLQFNFFSNSFISKYLYFKMRFFSNFRYLLPFLCVCFQVSTQIFTESDAIYNETEARVLFELVAAVHNNQPQLCLNSWVFELFWE